MKINERFKSEQLVLMNLFAKPSNHPRKACQETSKYLKHNHMLVVDNSFKRNADILTCKKKKKKKNPYYT